MKFLVALLILLVPLAASGATKPKNLCTGGELLYSVVPLNGAAGVRTKTLNKLDGFDFVRVSVKFDYTTAAGTIAFVITSPTAVPGPGLGAVVSAQQSPSSASCTAGVCTLSLGLQVITASLSADTNYDFIILLDGETELQFVATHGGTPTGAELLTVTTTNCVGHGGR